MEPVQVGGLIPISIGLYTYYNIIRICYMTVLWRENLPKKKNWSNCKKGVMSTYSRDSFVLYDLKITVQYNPFYIEMLSIY